MASVYELDDMKAMIGDLLIRQNRDIPPFRRTLYTIRAAMHFEDMFNSFLVQPSPEGRQEAANLREKLGLPPNRSAEGILQAVNALLAAIEDRPTTPPRFVTPQGGAPPPDGPLSPT